MKMFKMNTLKVNLMLVFTMLSLQAWGVDSSSNTITLSTQKDIGTFQAAHDVRANSASAQALASSIFQNGFEGSDSAPAITNFNASLSSIMVGESTSLSWTTDSVTSCTPSSGTGGWSSVGIDLPNGNTQIEFSTEGTSEFTLTCFGAAGQDISTVVVTATNPTSACDVGLTSNKMKEWNTFFGAVWPAPVSRETRVRVPELGYYAVRFETGDVVDSGAVATFEASGTAGQRILSISETPGCFDVATECKAEGRKTGIGWNTTGSGHGCELKSHTSYYWNVTFTDGFTPGSSTCLGTFCDTYLWVINQD